MATTRLALLCLILAGILMLQAVADDHKSGEKRNVEEPNGGGGVAAASGPVESSATGETSELAEAPVIRRMGKHHSTDESVAGGGVIIGGLVTAIFAAVFCYIRVTRKRAGDGGAALH
ncbi:hypothetical protein Tsubulata_031365 [Turnera subulata]|uniref:Uncharacterized protein n=1 Tax=Turnera subulata TaxID=218843 RepID=A0A9Q0JMM0_9ROSI|nr:hypothetical protein Tsubulata_031365 [Turnera subulata]